MQVCDISLLMKHFRIILYNEKNVYLPFKQMLSLENEVNNGWMDEWMNEIENSWLHPNPWLVWNPKLQF